MEQQPPSDLEDRISTIRDSVKQFRSAQLYFAFAELEIGPALDQEALTIADLAARIEVDSSALRRFLEAALAFDLVVESTADTIALSPLGRAIYAPTSDTSIAHSLKLEGAFYRRWGRLAEAVRLGRRPEANREQEDDPDWVHMFTMALYENSRDTAEAVASAIEPLFEDGNGDQRRVLDLGGGHGGYSLALARRAVNVSATIFDLPPVIETTRQIVADSGLQDRVYTLSGDFHKDPIGSDYWAVLLFGVLHGETPDGAVRLLHTIRKALAPDGLLLIRSQAGSRSEASRGERELLDLHMLLSTEGGRVQRAGDIHTLVNDNGFELLEEIPLQAPTRGVVFVFRSLNDYHESEGTCSPSG